MCEELASERARRVQGIYNMVMIKFKEEKRSQRKEPLSKLFVTELEPGLAGTKINISKEETEGESACWGPANLEVESEGSIVETEGHCIWKARQLVALRQEMHKEHLGSISLKLQLSFLKEELAGLKAKCKNLVAGFEEAKQELSHSRKETLCKVAQLEQLQKQSLHKDSMIEALKGELQEKSATINSLEEELRQARVETLQLGLLKKDLHQELKELKDQQDFEAKLSAAKAVLHFEAERRKTQRELEDAERALGAERALNTENSKALATLKKHFAGPPSSDVAENLRIYYL
ncbi:coiled-coil domain-containing protein 160 [Tiliqua scincoides]|uniref:coiled-coil domain-containing protein 160 n=1 Tax=Tiliqua scincoides TaxID=71010 RepID=UPI0034620819